MLMGSHALDGWWARHKRREPMHMKKIILGAMLTALAACGVGEATVSDLGKDTPVSGTGMSWEQFRAQVKVVPTTGAFIADGDTTFASEKLLREFYEMNVQEGQLIVNRIGNADDKWADSKKMALTYCVSNTFPSARKTQVINAMAEATAAWEAAAAVNFDYVPAQDANCTNSNNNVIFNVVPINVNGQYIAASFFPSDTRANRVLNIDNSAFTDTSLNFVGVLRHELGHTLGFRHEHTRPEAGATSCFEDNNWRALTSYDSSSVMHYPQCNGTGSFDDLSLTALDKQGVAALYGASGTGGGSGSTGGGSGSTGGGSGSTGGGSGSGTATTENFTGSVAKNATKAYGPFAVTAGTDFTAAMTGTGDADLYVRFGASPTASTYNCRPYLNGSNETCDLTVPVGQTQAYILISGYAAATYQLAVTYTKSGGTTTPPSSGTPKTATASGSVAKNQFVQVPAVSVLGGSALKVTMTGTGDADLYVRFDSAPTLTAFDCRPYTTGSAETCTLTVPASATKAYVGVNGYQAGTYSITTNYVAP